MKKKVIATLLATAMVSTLVACGTETTEQSGSEGGIFTAGTYEGAGQGFGGEITATVTLSADKIEEIVIGEHNETVGIGTIAIDSMPGEMVSKQAVNIDVVGGATVTSDAIIEAVTSALNEAGVDASTLVASEESIEKREETLDVDVVVVGAGGAGMTAALEAHNAGLNVLVVEKMAMAGGNTTKATGGMNAADTEIQAAFGEEDSVELFVQDTITGGYDLNDVDLVTVMAEESSDAVEWLGEIGAPLEDLTFSGGASAKRIHRPEDGSPVGAYIVEALVENLEEKQIEIIYNTEATEIIMADGIASGIKAEGKDANYTINAEAVILATGGFGANEDMYTEYRPELEGFVTTNIPGATGDGITMAEEVGANLIDIDQIQIHPTVEQSTSLLITESVRGDGGILVNAEGLRFTNELLTRDVVSQNVLAQTDGFAWEIFDQRLADGLAATSKYFDAGIVIEGATYEELAEKLELDPTVFAETMNTWNTAVANQSDAEFERTTGMEEDLSVGPFYAIKIAPGVHHTMGGVEINTEAEVVATTGEEIPGLFAAGEVVGGVHGGNRIGGTAVTDIIVFGRIAAESVIEYVNQ